MTRAGNSNQPERLDPCQKGKNKKNKENGIGLRARPTLVFLKGKQTSKEGGGRGEGDQKMLSRDY